MTYDVGLLLDGLILVFLSVTIFYAARLSLFLKSFREGKNGMQLLIRDLSLTVDKAEESIQNMKLHALETEDELREVINEAKFLSDELRFMNETGDSLANRLEKLADRNRELVDLMEGAGGIGTQKITPYAPANNRPPKPQAKTESNKAKPFIEETFSISDFEIDDDDEHDFYALEDGAYREEEIEYKKAQEEKVHKPKIDTNAKSKLRSFAIFDRDHLEDKETPVDIADDLAYSAQSNDWEDEEKFEDVLLEANASTGQFHSQAEQDLYEALQRRKRDSRQSLHKSKSSQKKHIVSEIT